MAVSTVRHHKWSEVSADNVTPQISRRYITGARVTLARFLLQRGAVVPMHKHESEQISYIVEGALKFRIGGEDIVVRAGEVLEIPGWVEHEAEAVDDCLVIDCFSPVRQDWIDHTDSYFRAGK
jgi:unsaturated pyranuronate lyase